ncbi:MAG: bifunctional homocysteine S-methyltransferase/methylenetetrahydrofolate reductase [Anaerolineales bacterium]|nr:bifunctional homocysteine S-methyltransferase/methylenetetrahydrofolate reductase [Anaerolineales bacterium]MCS7247406.1 bifunctional homocysteine S-methyltransferase/methylenetetrahydrofolate reductase [Anaerolineales bacterium]MDW8161217.1 bifunctional homocysteine S-methyltransferase/methylenetetrahydrofolate reductase [Anaerolineales bacterium]MDW8448253.1 bifunctional homocysteine S-methyltransferase/methylenetetrahydrofolate reductase [Anaerolineales bacterium]
MKDSGTLKELLLESGIPLLSDGAMGTELHARGISINACFDALNLANPELVFQIHSDYLRAGSDLLQTNTFGANRYKLAQHGLEKDLKRINQQGVTIARQAAQLVPKKVYILGDVGPLGVRLAPYGRVQPEQARRAFLEQIEALLEAGVDGIILETFSDLNEIQEAIYAVKALSSLPLIASMTFTRDDVTLLGDTPAQVARQLHALGVDVIGVNCSGGPAQVWRILRQMRQALATSADLLQPFSAMPNAGWPEQVGGRIMYPANAEYFGEYALAFCEAGARVVGGCCGTTPAHIAAMRAALDGQAAGCAPSVSELSMPVELEEAKPEREPPSHLARKLAEGKFVISVEMDPPRGLSTHKLLAGASLLSEAGADVINVADSPMARMRMSPWAVCELIQRTFGIETILHFPTRGRNLLRVQGDLLAAHALGIRNVFVVMGDPTAIGDYPNAMDNYDLVPSGLIKLIKEHLNAGFDQAGAELGQPTQFFVGCALNLVPPDFGQEAKNLQRKLNAGADFILTQPVFQPQRAADFLRFYQDRYGELSTPILVGVLPLYSLRHALFLHNEVPGIQIQEETLERMRRAGERAPQEGVHIALELIEQMRSWASGIYLMPAFHRYDIAAEIIETCRDLT